MSETPIVRDAKTAKEIAIEAAKSMWRYTVPSSFYEVRYDESDKSWNVEVSYFEEKLTFKIDAATGNVSTFRIKKISRKK